MFLQTMESPPKSVRFSSGCCAADNSGGVLRLADGWYKAPVANHEYRFKIVHGSSVWTYCIQDRTAGEAYDCHNTSDSWTSGTYSWYGTETNNNNSQNGNSFDESELNKRNSMEPYP